MAHHRTDDVRIEQGDELLAPMQVMRELPATERSEAATFEARRAVHDILRGADDMVLVPDAAIAQAIRDLLRYTHNLAEGAGAAPLAAIRTRAAQLAGQRVAMILSGGNIDAATLRRVLADEIR